MLTDPARLIVLAPVVFALHVVEEAPGFVSWFNSLVPAQPITEDAFYTVNGVGFVITLIVTAMVAIARERGAALVALAWISFLMFANGLLHIVGTVAHARYAPGVVTSAVLYLPYAIWFGRQAIRGYAIDAGPAATAIILGMAPMLTHGYLILFAGSRLF